MLADVHILHRSDFYQIVDFKCHCNVCSITQPEYNESLCISFIRKGFFEYRVFNGNQEAHIGRILISKPGFEHTTKHIDNQPDITTVFEFREEFLETLKEHYSDCRWFLTNNDIHSILLNCGTTTDYQHYRILQHIQSRKKNQLQTDEMVMELIDMVMNILSNKNPVDIVPDNVKQFHLPTIEAAQQYMLQHYHENISLRQLSVHCHTSPFHFSRLFKAILNMAPHQYLLGIRLQHAKMMISTSDKPVGDIAFECGFNSLEHFTTTYRQQYKISPSQHRKQLM